MREYGATMAKRRTLGLQYVGKFKEGKNWSRRKRMHFYLQMYQIATNTAYLDEIPEQQRKLKNGRYAHPVSHDISGFWKLKLQNQTNHHVARISLIKKWTFCFYCVLIIIVSCLSSSSPHRLPLSCPYPAHPFHTLPPPL